MSRKITQQITSVKWWGRWKYVAQQSMFYASALMLLFTAISAYATGISPWLQQYGINLPFVAFIAIVGLILTIAVVFEYKVTLPGFHSVWNEQWWRHDNPMKKELEEHDAKLKKIINILEQNSTSEVNHD